MNRKLLFSILMGFSLFSCGPDVHSPEENIPKEKSAPAKMEEKEPAPEENRKVILFFGNSLTAGYGLQEEETFPARIQQKLDSLGYPYRVVKSGRNGETSAQGLKRIDEVLKQHHVDIFVLELGINDALQGFQADEIYENLAAIINKVRSVYPNVQIILAGINPQGAGENLYNDDFRRIYPRLARDMEVDLIPQLLREVYGEDSLTLDDDLHPNKKGTEIISDNVWEVLEGHLERPI